MSADLLRRAAAKIRETAQAATPGPWVVDHDADAQIAFPGRQSHKENVLPEVVSYQGIDGGISSASNVDHIALWSPDVAELVARVLDESAGWCEMYDDPGEAERVLHAEFALARRILGED